MSEKTLFSDYLVHNIIKTFEDRLRKAVNDLEGNKLLGTSTDEWAEYYVSEYRLNTPRLAEDQIQADQEEVDIDVSGDRRRIFRSPGPHYVKGVTFKFFVPFDGNGDMFSLQPLTCSMSPPTAKVDEHELVFSYSRTEISATDVKLNFDNDLAQVRLHLERLEKEVANYNSSIEGNARAYLTARKTKLLANEQAIGSFGFPIRRRDGASKTYVVPEVKRKIPVAPVARPSGGPAEPVLELKEYEHILSVISNMTAVMERSPHAFTEMGEEDLRQHYLVQLNGQYEGQATGETFNFEGKTDILIRSNGKNVFIAECKFWKGAASFTQALTQLLSYAAWRDTKLALVIFNRNKDLSSVIQQIPDLLQGNPNFVGALTKLSETSYRCTMHINGDKQREATVTVLVFNIPTESATK